MRLGTRKEPINTIARFQSCLNFDTRDKVEILPHDSLNELVQLCLRV